MFEPSTVLHSPNVTDKPYHYPESLVVMTVAVVTSFVFLTLGCWWSLWCTYIAIALGASVSELFRFTEIAGAELLFFFLNYKACSNYAPCHFFSLL